jgi:hypothetical protein
MSERTMTDWMGRTYTVEVAYVCFLGGYVVWVDDDTDGEPFPSERAAWEAMRLSMLGRTP